MQFKVGDRVRFLDDVGEGVISQVESNSAIVLMDHGFEEEMQLSNLVPVMDLSVGEVEIKKEGLPPKKKSKPAKSKQQEKLVVDLHAGVLIGNTAGLSNHEILIIQLEHAQTTLEEARKNGIRRVDLIHGKGKGKLREELYKVLSKMDKVNVFDAEYRFYSQGATTVELL